MFALHSTPAPLTQNREIRGWFDGFSISLLLLVHIQGWGAAHSELQTDVLSFFLSLLGPFRVHCLAQSLRSRIACHAAVSPRAIWSPDALMQDKGLMPREVTLRCALPGSFTDFRVTISISPLSTRLVCSAEHWKHQQALNESLIYESSRTCERQSSSDMRLSNAGIMPYWYTESWTWRSPYSRTSCLWKKMLKSWRITGPMLTQKHTARSIFHIQPL